LATDEAIVPGSAPGSDALTFSVGNSTCGRSLTGSARYATTPNSVIAAMRRLVAMGRRIKISDGFTKTPLKAIETDIYEDTTTRSKNQDACEYVDCRVDDHAALACPHEWSSGTKSGQRRLSRMRLKLVRSQRARVEFLMRAPRRR